MNIKKAHYFAVAAFALAGYSPASAADIQITMGDARTPSIIEINGQSKAETPPGSMIFRSAPIKPSSSFSRLAGS